MPKFLAFKNVGVYEGHVGTPECILKYICNLNVINKQSPHSCFGFIFFENKYLFTNIIVFFAVSITLPIQTSVSEGNC